MNTIEQRKLRQQEERQIAEDFSFNLSAFLKGLWPAVHTDFHSEQHCKKGPGRKHKQGKKEYIPQGNDNALWDLLHMPRVKRAAIINAGAE